MRLLTASLLTLWLAQALLGQTLAINEFLASNDACCTDEFGDYDDWVELYNYGDQPVDLAGLWFSDEAGVSGWQIPDDDDEITTVQPGGFIVVWFDEEMEQGPLHVDDKLSAGGESIVVHLEDGVTELLRHDFGAQTTDVSEGRETDGDGDWTFFETPTPGASNETVGVGAPLQRPGGLALLAAAPNPFNPATVVRWRLDAPAELRLRVHDLPGRRVDGAELGRRPAGEGAWLWTPASGLASGAYWLRLEAGGTSDAMKVLLLR